MSSEHKNGRVAVDRMTKRLVETSNGQLSHEQARDRAIDSVRKVANGERSRRPGQLYDYEKGGQQ